MQQYKEQAKEISNIQKLCPITECISQINNTDKDHAEYLNIVMPKYNLIEHRKNYTKTGHLWQYHIDIPHDNILNSETFTFKARITKRTPADGNTKNVEIVRPLKYMSNFWRTLKTPSINCELNLLLNWSAYWVITNSTGTETFEITYTSLYVPVVALSAEGNTKPQQQLNSGFKRTIN